MSNGPILAKSVYLCVIRGEMLVFKKFLGQSETYDSIRNLQQRGELEPIDSWSEPGLTYEKYDAEGVQRVWSRIVKSQEGLQSLDKVPSEGTWGLLYEL